MSKPYRTITKQEALDLIVKQKSVFNISTGLYYTYTPGVSTTVVFAPWIVDLPEEGWIVYE
jgi:hypothetical protein